MGSGLEFKIGGRTVSHDQFFKNMEQSVIDLASNAIEKRVSAVRCPVHGKSAGDLRQKPNRAGKVEWTYSVCCAELRAAVERALS